MTRMRKILVTGAAGFIGFHLAKRLIADGKMVTGLDNLNDYYDVSLKQSRLSCLDGHENFRFVQGDLSDRRMMEELFADGQFDCVVNLAAQAGVRYSLKNPHAYIDSNVVGFLNVLEGCRHTGVKHLVYASSSSVYGANTRMPFLFTITSTIRYPFTRRPKRPTSLWRIPMRACTVCR